MSFIHSLASIRTRALMRLISLLLFLPAVAAHAPVAAQTPDATPPAAPAETRPAENRPAENRPALYGFVVDNSGSLRTDLDSVIEAARTLIDGTAAPSEAFVIRFVSSSNIQLLHDFTSNKARLKRSLDEMYIEGGRTAISDALYLAAEHLSDRAPEAADVPRRTLVLITDGEDAQSRYKPEQVLALLREKRITVHVLGLPYLVKRNQGKKAYEKATGYLNLLAQQTGGRAVLVQNSEELDRAVGELLKVLHSQ